MEETSLFSYSKQKNLYFPFFKNKQKTNKQTNKQTKKNKRQNRYNISIWERGGPPTTPQQESQPKQPKKLPWCCISDAAWTKKKVKNNKIKIRLFILFFMHLYSSSTLFTHSLPNTFFLEKFKYFSFSHEVFSPGEQKI